MALFLYKIPQHETVRFQDCARIETVQYQDTYWGIMSKDHPNWGGKREGSGQKSKWNYPETKPIRLPVIFHQQIWDYAKQLDMGEAPLESVTGSSEELVVLREKLQTIVEFYSRWKAKSNAGSPTSPRWQYARQMLAELERLLDP